MRTVWAVMMCALFGGSDGGGVATLVHAANVDREKAFAKYLLSWQTDIFICGVEGAHRLAWELCSPEWMDDYLSYTEEKTNDRSRSAKLRVHTHAHTD